MKIGKGVLISFFCFLLVLNCVSAIRISPPKIEGNFKPEMETSVEYSVSSNLDRDLEFYARGDLAQYVTFDPPIVHQSGTTTATLKLPKTIEIPGPQRTYVGAREIADEEIASGKMAVAVAIEALILIHVPYPGKYLETSLSTESVNVGEPVDFRLKVISRGDEDLVMNPRIEIYSENDELMETLDLKEREVKSGETIELQKSWDTSSYGAGRYYAISKVDYGERVAVANTSFRIGELAISILNYSKEIEIGGTQSFWVEIESEWNDRIDGAFADVMLSNKTKINLISFRTSPTSLNPFQSETVRGYFDTAGFAPGKYEAEIEVTYYGKDQGKSTSKDVEVELFMPEETDWFLIILIIGVCIIGAIILLILFITFISKIKNGRKKK